jgi:hypothetical protein
MSLVRDGLTAGDQPLYGDADAAFSAELRARVAAAGERDGRSLEQRMEDHHADVTLQLHNPAGSVDRMGHPEAYGDAGTSLVAAGLTYGSAEEPEIDFTDPEARARQKAETDAWLAADEEFQALKAQEEADRLELAGFRQAKRDDALIEQVMGVEDPDEQALLWSMVSPEGRARFADDWGQWDADELTSAADRLTTYLELRRTQARLNELEQENLQAFQTDLFALEKLYGSEAIASGLNGLAADGHDVVELAKLDPGALAKSVAAGAEAWKAANSNHIRDNVLAPQILGFTPNSDGTRDFKAGYEVGGVREGDRRLAEYYRHVDELGLNAVDIPAAIERGRQLVASGGKRGQSADEIRAGVIGQERSEIAQGFEELRAQGKRLRDAQIAGSGR